MILKVKGANALGFYYKNGLRNSTVYHPVPHLPIPHHSLSAHTDITYVQIPRRTSPAEKGSSGSLRIVTSKNDLCKAEVHTAGIA
jgi:hypothetical protein